MYNQSMFKLSSDQKKWCDFLIIMTQKELRVKYKLSSLGFLWTILNPIIQMLVMGFIFSFFVPVNVNNYFIFIFSGLIMWNFVTTTISRSVTIIIDERSLIQKASFPKEILVLSIVAANLVQLLISFSLLMVVVFFMGGFNWYWIFLPFMMVPLLMVTSGLSLLLAALNVKNRDVNFVTQIGLNIWFYLTPVFYTLELIPIKQIIIFFGFNPMVGIVDITRFFLIGLQTKYLYIDLFSVFMSFVIFIIGISVFKKTSLFFNEWI